MASTSIVITCERKVLVSHICSKCGFPVTSIVTMHIQSQQQYFAFKEKAEKKAREAAENAIEEEIHFIENHAKVEPLTGKERGIGDFGEPYCKMSFTGHDSKCPHCGNSELWQMKASSKKEYAKAATELNEECFPIVFKFGEEANEWANNHVKKIVNKIEEMRCNKTVSEQAVSNTLSSAQKILSWKKELLSIPELGHQNKLMEQLKILEERKKQLGVFNLSEKKEINAQIKALEDNLKNINKVVEDKVPALLEMIAEEENKVLFSQAIAFGCSGQVQMKQKENAFAYLFEPLPIPQQLL